VGPPQYGSLARDLEGRGAEHREASGELSGYSLHMADSGTDNFDRDFALSLLSSDQDAVYEIEEAEGIYFIATEYIDGLTIRERIRAVDLSLKDVLDIAGQLLTGLEAAHAAGIIHRDIKPENVIQRHDGVVKILDFGIAKLLEKAAPENPSTSSPIVRTETGVGVMLGTIGYMSPEQVRGLAVDVRTDIWSCGVVLYEMLGGERPFDGQTNADTLVTMLEREPEPLFGTGAQTPGALRQIQVVVDKALCKEPAERYQSAAEMRTILEKIKTELEVNQQSAAIALTNARDLRSLAAQTNAALFRRAIVMTIAVLLITIAFAAAFLYQRQKARTRANTLTVKAANRPYLQMSEAEKLAFVEAQEQRISNMMGDRSVKLNDEALRVIKVRVDRYATRQNSVSLKPGEESLRSTYARAPEYIPVIARAFAARKIPIVVGVYLPMIESAYRPCYENENGSKGLFQFMPQTAAVYGVSRAEMCDVQKMAPAAAHFIADRMAANHGAVRVHHFCQPALQDLRQNFRLSLLRKSDDRQRRNRPAAQPQDFRHWPPESPHP
jgi:hypothetical protein